MKNIYTSELTGLQFAEAVSGSGRHDITAAMYSALQAHSKYAHDKPGSCKCLHTTVIAWTIANLDLYEKWPGVGPKRIAAIKTLGSTGPEYWKTLCEGSYWGRTGRIMHKPHKRRH